MKGLRAGSDAEASTAVRRFPTRVVFLTAVLPQYRVPFHEGVRARLAAAEVQYDLIFGQPGKYEATKGDFANLSWAMPINNRYVQVGPFTAVWQPALREMWNSDLLIIGQENRLVINYMLQTLRSFRPGKLALWGHGRNFQAEAGRGLSERWKGIWATRCDWWFGYTEETRSIVQRCGFPADRITVFNNAIDTSELRRVAEEIDESQLIALRAKLGIGRGPVGVYVGGIYDHKRIDFLIEAAVEVRRRTPDFVLIIVGSGSDRWKVEAAAATHPWIIYMGPRFGREKVELLRLGQVFLMPGLVGLAILDCAAVGIPIITTAYPYHSPEIAYLKPGHNGMVVQEWRSVRAYADAVVSMLHDEAARARMAAGAKDVAASYSIERMVQCFSDGVIAALASPKR
jgi:glycosyltransferase involved in cell wall biosynthesis